MIVLLLGDALMMGVALRAAYAVRFQWEPMRLLFPVTKGIPPWVTFQQTLLVMTPAWWMFFAYTGLYRGRFPPAFDEWIAITKAVSLGTVLLMAATFVYRGPEYSRLTIGCLWLFAIVSVFLYRTGVKAVYRRFFRRWIGPQRLLILGKGKALETLKTLLRRQPHLKAYFTDGVMDPLALTQFVTQHRINEVLVAQNPLDHKALLSLADTCEKLHVDFKIIPDLVDLRRGEIIIDDSLGIPTFHLKAIALHGTNFFLKRSFDLIMAFVLVTVFFFPLLAIAILILLDSHGSVLYHHLRMGHQGKTFPFFKFRTMVSRADQMLYTLRPLSERVGPVFKMKNDPRVTRVGHWLRRYSLDEIPQLLNVFRGEMNLVGPRPQVLWEAETYDDMARKRLKLISGITGLWQVSGRASVSYQEMIDLDLYYLENWSLGLDLKILLRTIPTVLTGRGAY
ncbi:MAG: sugar transferase [Elusimicrobia bacterium]|nr:sugar transferase [Elusimicrobiota bacterium]